MLFAKYVYVIAPKLKVKSDVYDGLFGVAPMQI